MDGWSVMDRMTLLDYLKKYAVKVIEPQPKEDSPKKNIKNQLDDKKTASLKLH